MTVVGTMGKVTRGIQINAQNENYVEAEHLSDSALTQHTNLGGGKEEKTLYNT